MTKHVPVSVVAHDPLSRAGLVAELANRDEIRLVCQGDEEAPEVTVLVADHVDEGTVRTIRTARRNGCPKVCLIVTTIDDRGLFAAIEAGVCGILRRSEATPTRVAETVHAAAVGNGAMPADLLGRLLEQLGRLQRDGNAPADVNLSGLSEREAQVLRLVAEGLDTGEIAQRLAYSERTIKNVIQNVTIRFNLRNRSHAVAYVLRHGLL